MKPLTPSENFHAYGIIGKSASLFGHADAPPVAELTIARGGMQVRAPEENLGDIVASVLEAAGFDVTYPQARLTEPDGGWGAVEFVIPFSNRQLPSETRAAVYDVVAKSPRAGCDPDERRWARPCEEMFEHLARTSPAALREHLVNPTYSAGLRARAARAAAKVTSTTTALKLLLPLLSAEPIVREGAIYGLLPHRTAEVLDRLRRLADDPATTAGVREAAVEALEDAE